MELFLYVLYCGKEKIHSKIDLIVYELKWYSPTSIISLGLLVQRPKLVLQLTNVIQSCLSDSLSASLSVSASPCLRDTVSLILPRCRKSCGTSHYTTVCLTKLIEIELFFDIETVLMLK